MYGMLTIRIYPVAVNCRLCGRIVRGWYHISHIYLLPAEEAQWYHGIHAVSGIASKV